MKKLAAFAMLSMLLSSCGSLPRYVEPTRAGGATLELTRAPWAGIGLLTEYALFDNANCDAGDVWGMVPPMSFWSGQSKTISIPMVQKLYVLVLVNNEAGGLVEFSPVFGHSYKIDFVGERHIKMLSTQAENFESRFIGNLSDGCLKFVEAIVLT